MKISVVTVPFNSESTIRDTIESVLSQTYPDIEYIIIDGGSTDQTIEILGNYNGQTATVVSEPDRGIYDAMNKGIQAATGEYICFLNSDDVYSSSDSLACLADVAQTGDLDCVYSDMLIVHSQNLNKVIRYYDASKFHPGRLRYGWMPPHPTFLAKRQLYEQHGGFSLEYSISADFEMMVRLLHHIGISYAHVPRITVRMRAGGISSAGLLNRWILNREIVRSCRAYGIETSLPRVLLKTPAKLIEHWRRP